MSFAFLVVVAALGFGFLTAFAVFVTFGFEIADAVFLTALAVLSADALAAEVDFCVGVIVIACFVIFLVAEAPERLAPVNAFAISVLCALFAVAFAAFIAVFAAPLDTDAVSNFLLALAADFLAFLAVFFEVAPLVPPLPVLVGFLVAITFSPCPVGLISLIWQVFSSV